MLRHYSVIGLFAILIGIVGAFAVPPAVSQLREFHDSAPGGAVRVSDVLYVIPDPALAYLSQREAAAAFGSLSAWAGTDGKWYFSGYGTVSCPNGGCTGTLTVNIYYWDSWRGGNSVYGTFANKTIGATDGSCAPSRFSNKLSVVATFSGGYYKRSDFWYYMAC